MFSDDVDLWALLPHACCFFVLLVISALALEYVDRRMHDMDEYMPRPFQRYKRMQPVPVNRRGRRRLPGTKSESDTYSRPLERARNPVRSADNSPVRNH